MSHWNYRVIKTLQKDDPDPEFGIHEVHYSDDGKISAWSESPVPIVSCSVDELFSASAATGAALNKPVLIEQVIDGEAAT